MDFRRNKAPIPGPSLNVCMTCSELNLRITDFFNTVPSGEVRLDVWGTFRRAPLGTLKDILCRQDCPICCLAAKVIYLKSTGDIDHQDPTQYNTYLRWEDPIWDKEIGNLRRPVFLGFGSDFDRYDIYFVPTMYNAMSCRVPTTQYSARHLKTIADKCRLVQQWLENCVADHGFACSGKHDSTVEQQGVWAIPGFVLIDVHKQCLVDASMPCKYAALSYVWGRRSFFRLTQSNASRLRQPGSLKEHEKLIPKTIADAINFIHRIGERYLWVDSLCIVQDDSNQKYGLIDSMNLIFGGAFLTIIAATGKHANEGLFHGQNLRERIAEGFDLAGIDFFQSRHEQRKWFHETRGWTYQEQLLSKRQVIFAEGLAFFVCSKAAWREDLVTEETEILAGQGEITRNFQRPLQPPRNPDEAISTYISCVEAYSRRNLSFPEDALSAFAGISKILENHLKTSMFYGLPIRYFEFALLWTPKGGNLTRRQGFPTWSWAGWCGEVDLSQLRRATDWLRSTSTAGIFTIQNDYKYYEPTKASFCSLETYPKDCQVQTPKANRQTPCLQTRRLSWPAVMDGSVNRAGILRFQALCATFTVAIFEQPQNRSDRSNIAILDTDDNLIGELEDGHEWQLEDIPRLLGIHEVIVISEKFSEPWHYGIFSRLRRRQDNAIALQPVASMHGQLKSRDRSFLTPAAKDSSSLPQVRSVRSRLDMKLHEPVDWKLFNVMIVEWHEGVAYRLGIGWIFKEALAKSFPPGGIKKMVTLG